MVSRYVKTDLAVAWLLQQAMVQLNSKRVVGSCNTDPLTLMVAKDCA